MNHIKYLIVTIFLLGLASCSDLLDQPVLDAIDSDAAFSNFTNAESFIYGTYADITGVISNGTNQKYNNAYQECLTMNAFGVSTPYSSVSSIFQGTYNSTGKNLPFLSWDQFGKIRKCNMIIENVAASSGITPVMKLRLIAEGKFLRAVMYWHLTRTYGRPIWVDKVLSPSDSLRLSNVASISESYAHIIQDLTDAVAGLPETALSGRATSSAASALLSEVCLAAVAYSNYPNGPDLTSEANKALIQKSIDNALLVTAKTNYSMDSNYGQMFNENNAKSKEIIWAWYQDALTTQCQHTPMQGMMPTISTTMVTKYGGSPQLNVAFNAWCQYVPTQNLTDDYLVTDQATGKALPWNETSQFKAATDNTTRPGTSVIPHASNETDIEYGSIVNGSNQTIWKLTNEGRDARWAASIISDSCAPIFTNTVTTCIKGNATRWMYLNGITGSGSTKNYITFTNYYWRKGVYTDMAGNQVSKTNYTSYHQVLLRLGRVYLNLAEAYLLQGKLPEALSALNQTRTVHGKLPVSIASTLGEAWVDYKRERKVDLVLENDYYWSLLRWGLYGGLANHNNPQAGDIPELNEVPRVMDISKDRKSYVITEGAFYSSNNRRYFDYYRRYIFPIPFVQIEANSNITQNDAW